jgi:hypothetical protein
MELVLDAEWWMHAGMSLRGSLSTRMSCVMERDGYERLSSEWARCVWGRALSNERTSSAVLGEMESVCGEVN